MIKGWEMVQWVKGLPKKCEGRPEFRSPTLMYKTNWPRQSVSSRFSENSCLKSKMGVVGKDWVPGLYAWYIYVHKHMYTKKIVSD